MAREIRLYQLLKVWDAAGLVTVQKLVENFFAGPANRKADYFIRRTTPSKVNV